MRLRRGLFVWFSEVLRSAVPAGGSLLAYHIPPVSGVPISLDLLARLKDAFPDRFAGLKDSSGEPEFAPAFGGTFRQRPGRSNRQRSPVQFGLTSGSFRRHHSYGKLALSVPAPDLGRSQRKRPTKANPTTPDVSTVGVGPLSPCTFYLKSSPGTPARFPAVDRPAALAAYPSRSNRDGGCRIHIRMNRL
jgi:hypothetical protein